MASGGVCDRCAAIPPDDGLLLLALPIPSPPPTSLGTGRSGSSARNTSVGGTHDRVMMISTDLAPKHTTKRTNVIRKLAQRLAA